MPRCITKSHSAREAFFFASAPTSPLSDPQTNYKIFLLSQLVIENPFPAKSVPWLGGLLKQCPFKCLDDSSHILLVPAGPPNVQV